MNTTWTRDEIKKSIPEFLELYKHRPIDYNDGGMLAPHMFATWFMMRQMQPKTVIESGVYKGQSTWLIEQTVPDAEVFSIDIKLSQREYISKNVTYFDQDFSTIDWSFVEDKENTLLFFDDHQNAVVRLQQVNDFGFQYCIFEDNYPIGKGDCMSLKKASKRPDNYYEFPPVYVHKLSRWGNLWSEYTTPDPIYDKPVKGLEVFMEDVHNYTWICLTY